MSENWGTDYGGMRGPFQAAKKTLSYIEGGKVSKSIHDYELFRFTSPDVSIIFYQPTWRRTGKHTVHIRDCGSKDVAGFVEACKRLLNDHPYGFMLGDKTRELVDGPF